jgi:hypothetical protein
MKDYVVELEIFEGNSGQLHSDGTYPDFVKEGICAWMYGRLEVGIMSMVGGQFDRNDPCS